jgi:hypothetical protein
MHPSSDKNDSLRSRNSKKEMQLESSSFLVAFFCNMIERKEKESACEIGRMRLEGGRRRDYANPITR